MLVALFALAFGGALVYASRETTAGISTGGGEAENRASSLPRHFDSNVVVNVAADPAVVPKPATPAVISATTEPIADSDGPDSDPDPTPSPEARLALRESLRLAAADENPDIAERAKDAYDELMRDED